MRPTRRSGPARRVLLAAAVTLMLLVAAPRSAGAAGPTGAARPATPLRTPTGAAARPAVSDLASSSSTIPGIARQLPTLSTIPFTTTPPNAHVSPVFSDLSIGGFAVFVLIIVVQLVLTRPSRRGGRTL